MLVLSNQAKTSIDDFYTRQTELLDVLSTAADDALRRFEEILKMTPEKTTFQGVFETVVRLSSILIPGMPAARALLIAAGTQFGVTEDTLKQTYKGVEHSAWAMAGAEAWKHVYQTVKPDLTTQNTGLDTLEKIHEKVAAAKEKAVNDMKAAKESIDGLIEIADVITLNAVLPIWKVLPRPSDFPVLAKAFRSMMLYEFVRRHVAANVAVSARESSFNAYTDAHVLGMNAAQVEAILERFNENNADWMPVPAPIRLRRMKPLNRVMDFHDVLGCRIKWLQERHSVGMKV